VESNELLGKGGSVLLTRSYGFPARRVLLCVLCLAAFLLVGCSGSEPAQEGQEEAEATTKKPNIVFVLTDDLDYASAQKMPNLRSLLIDQGVSFENAFVSHPVCCPSRTTILTGLYDHNHDVRSNNPPDGGFRKFVSEGHEEHTIAVSLQEGGYRTAFFGKYLNGYPDGDPTHVPPGWDEWYGKEKGQKLYDYDINENGEVVSYGDETEDFYTDVLSGQTTDFVRRAAPEEQPFFMYVAPTAPHGPATPAERHQGALADEEAPRPPSFDEEDVSDKPSWIRNTSHLSDKETSEIDDRYRKRLESMLAVDEMAASLVQELENAGELDNTFIFFTSDNGFEQGEHRIEMGKNRPYEESAHVPLFVRGPGVPAGSKMEKLAVNTDFAPTFAGLAGLKFPADGRSLAPLLRGEDTLWRSSILLERLGKDSDDEEENGKGKGKGKAGGNGQSAFEAVRTETHKYVEYDNGEKELYDLEADPYELDSAHETADPSLIEDLKTKLDALRRCSGAGCREAEDAP
jgi:N-acetylglucosamine-6-sulfatase